MPALFVFLAGCAQIPPHVGELEADTASLELVDTPFFPQERYQCGPAALATALASSGVVLDPAALVDNVYLPGREGSLQVELLAATRTAGRIPYVVDGTLKTLLHELGEGRPIVVLQNLGVAAIPKWHYAVVVGIDTERNQVILRSGTDRRRITRTQTFLKTWRRSDYWGFVVLRPNELPSGVDRRRYLKAVAEFEKAGRDAEAAIAWHTALTIWPTNPIAMFGLGNTLLATGDNAAAEKHFRAILEQDPGSIAVRNNLAIALARQSRFADARNEITAALEGNDDPALQEELENTAALVEDLVNSKRP